MFLGRNSLDSPPPASQFRRPWSPDDYVHDNYDGLPNNTSYGRWRNGQAFSDQGHGSAPQQGPSSGHRQQQRREPSDVSVEALDLADYAKTLRTRQTEDPYPPFPSQLHNSPARPQPRYPPSSFPGYVPQLAHSRDSLAMHPPSLISRGPTLSSATTHHTGSSSAPSFARRAARRPYSLPTTPQNSSQASHSSRGGRPHPHHAHNNSNSNRGPYIADPTEDEIDISNFPKWSRGWYVNNNTDNRRFGEMEDMYTPLPQAHHNSSKSKAKSPFDPGYVHDPYDTYTSGDPYDIPPPPSFGHESSRELLPWGGSEPPSYAPPLDPLTKEERYRLLEREYAGTGKGKGKDKEAGSQLVDEDGKPMIGTVDDKGNLVTTGPKRRITFRVLQFLFAVGACVPAIYAAVAIKFDAKDPPPPANKPPAYVLYVLSCITLLAMFYLFVIRPCCIRRRRPKSGPNAKNPFGTGMMVLPVTGGKKGGKSKPKGGKKGKKGGPPVPGDVQVNLIVDPKAFQPPGADLSSSSEEGSADEDGGLMPGGYDSYGRDRDRARRKRKRRRRRGLIEGLQMEEEWKLSRSWLKKMTVLDVGGCVVWGAIFVFVMTGQRCTTGEYNGWCNAYNISTACACLLAVAYAVSLFFDVQDLHSSKQSPRTRG